MAGSAFQNVDHVQNTALLNSAELSLELLLAPYLDDASETRGRLSESHVRQISYDLRRMGKNSWAKVPRLYTVLRMVNHVQVIDSFLTQGISDIWFPFSHKTLPESLRSASARFDFLELQDLVLTKAFDLEREDGRHRHFSKPEDIPLEKLQELGKGGHGFVDRVLSTVTYKEYARKLIPRGKTFKKNAEVLRDFERELGNLKKMSHIHIVELVGSYTDPRFVGILMSPVADWNLKDFLARAPLSPGEHSFLRTFFGCLANALCYLHQNRIRHKDIKPQNVLVKGHQVFLTDFGISLDWSELDQSTTTGVTAKTPRYCAPEVADHLPRNSLADMWSLGCVFLEIWTVLKGNPVDDILSHLVSQGTKSTCYYLNCHSAREWCSILEGETSSLEENPPVLWIYGMLQLDQEQRWTAQYLVDRIQEANENPDLRYAFAGVCCISGDDFTDCSSKRSSAFLEETGATSIGVYEPRSSGMGLEREDVLNKDLSSSLTVRPSKHLENANVITRSEQSMHYSPPATDSSACPASAMPFVHGTEKEKEKEKEKEVEERREATKSVEDRALAKAQAESERCEEERRTRAEALKAAEEEAAQYRKLEAERTIQFAEDRAVSMAQAEKEHRREERWWSEEDRWWSNSEESLDKAMSPSNSTERTPGQSEARVKDKAVRPPSEVNILPVIDSEHQIRAPTRQKSVSRHMSADDIDRRVNRPGETETSLAIHLRMQKPGASDSSAPIKSLPQQKEFAIYGNDLAERPRHPFSSASGQTAAPDYVSSARPPGHHYVIRKPLQSQGLEAIESAPDDAQKLVQKSSLSTQTSDNSRTVRLRRTSKMEKEKPSYNQFVEIFNDDFRNFYPRSIKGTKTHKKAVLVGDASTGATAAITRFKKNTFVEAYIPTIFESHLVSVELGGLRVELEVWDTGGTRNYDILHDLSYPNSDVAIIGFDINDPDSLDNVLDKWHDEVRHYLKTVPIVLAGYKSDLRSSSPTINGFSKASKDQVTYKQGKKVAEKIRAAVYVECSSKTGEGIEELYEVITKCAIMNGSEKKATARLKRFLGYTYVSPRDPLRITIL